MKMTQHFKLYLSLFIVWIFLLLTILFVFSQIDRKSAEAAHILRQSILQEATAHFKNILDTRKWNAAHNGVYVKDNGTIAPNPYLRDSTLKTDDNQTLIKINPAWMTRQISEIANKDNNYYYKITSLNPINPHNKADTFEQEALDFFEKNRDTEFYYSLSNEQDGKSKFDFMGSLKVTQSCMQCHEYQGYKIGDIRGGIRVSVPTQLYNESLVSLNRDVLFDKYKIVLLSFIIGLLVTVYLRRSLMHTLEIEKLNKDLEEKVQQRTKELHDINETLEERVREEIAKNRLKDEAMLTQSKHIAMGEMIRMLAHQWRQPIAVIDMQISNILIDIELGDENIQAINAELVNISNETQKLSQIIGSFSDLFEADSSKKLLKAEDALEDALSVLSGNIQEYGVVIEKNYKSESKIEIVSKNLFQVYWNILNNAIEILYQNKIYEPKIKITIEENLSEIVTQISDNGGGIKAVDYEKIFEPYYSTNEDLNGKGLGLYICKTIVQKDFGGSISVKNSAIGADFIIRIPKY
jgi:signal transduction histidine kinase